MAENPEALREGERGAGRTNYRDVADIIISFCENIRSRHAAGLHCRPD
jgi:hypothetical protein